MISFNNTQSFKIGSVGHTIENVEVCIAEDGEILTRGPHVMQGYWKNPIATAETIRDGWLHTGDVGKLDDEGFLSITDRKKDLFVTSAGKNIAPSELERLLTSDPFIDQAVVYGDGRHFISADRPERSVIESRSGKTRMRLDRYRRLRHNGGFDRFHAIENRRRHGSGQPTGTSQTLFVARQAIPTG